MIETSRSHEHRQASNKTLRFLSSYSPFLAPNSSASLVVLLRSQPLHWLGQKSGDERESWPGERSCSTATCVCVAGELRVALHRKSGPIVLSRPDRVAFGPAHLWRPIGHSKSVRRVELRAKQKQFSETWRTKIALAPKPLKPADASRDAR